MENELIDDFQSGMTESQQHSKQRGVVKTFGWISFVIAIFYLLSGLISLVSSSMMSSISKMSSSVSGNQMDYFESLSSLQMLNSTLTLIVALIVIIGSVGFVTFKEWGRKLYIGACVGGILTNLIGVFIALYSMSLVSELTQNVSGMSPQDAQIMEGVFGTFGSFFSIITIVFSLIPITYLVINIFIAINAKTKELMS